jgi:hypothetical protein
MLPRTTFRCMAVAVALYAVYVVSLCGALGQCVDGRCMVKPNKVSVEPPAIEDLPGLQDNQPAAPQEYFQPAPDFQPAPQEYFQPAPQHMQPHVQPHSFSPPQQFLFAPRPQFRYVPMPRYQPPTQFVILFSPQLRSTQTQSFRYSFPCRFARQ